MQSFCSTCREPRSSTADPYCRRCGALATEFEPIGLLRSHSAPPGGVAEVSAPPAPANGTVDARADPTLRAMAFRRAAILPSRRVSLGWLALIVALAGFAIAGATLSLVNYRRASAWERRTHAAEQRASDVSAQLDASQSQLKLTALAVGASNKDRDALQTRIDALAGEKANAEDQQQLAQKERDAAVGVFRLASRAAVDARQCLSDVSTALGSITNHAPAASANSLISRAEASCAASDTSYASFAAGVNSLP